jgi:hypothetical protein
VADTRTGLKQPGLGIAATVLIMAVALAFVSLFDFPTFAGWIAYFLLCVIPIQIVMVVTWGGLHPRAAASAAPPVRGMAMTVFALVVGAIVAAAALGIAGGGITPPTPMVAHWAIVAVPITFWAAIMWGGWPFTKLIRNPVAAGLTLLVACYIVNHVLFRLLFNYEFMQGAPVYVPALDPHGLFNAWSALVFYVTALAAMFLIIAFDLWPMTKSRTLMQQPVLGVVWTIAALVIGGVAFYTGVWVMRMDVVAFLVAVPVPFIFGSIVVLNMLQNSVFAKAAQPAKGIMNTVAIVIIGTFLSRLYGALAPTVTGALKSGPPSYDFEIWLASALLSVTFPFLIFYAEFFKLWPLAAPTRARQEAPASAG